MFSTLIHNAETLSKLSALAKAHGNRNAVLNDALNIGVPILYEREFGREKKQAQQHTPSLGRELKILRNNTDDLFVELAVIETMIAGLFNVKAAELGGEEVNAGSLLDGSLCDLPELVAGIKSDLIGATKGKTDEQ